MVMYRISILFTQAIPKCDKITTCQLNPTRISETFNVFCLRDASTADFSDVRDDDLHQSAMSYCASG